MDYQVTVLLSTYNGEKYLREQIDSILNQRGVRCTILVRDDGSQDSTVAILQDYKSQGILDWYTGVNLRPAKSFFDLLLKSPASDYYAFCDQDNIWMNDKLLSGINKIQNTPIEALYCSDTLLVDADTNIIRKGNIKAEGTFFESLISNPVTGCTAIFNKKLRDRAISYQPSTIDMHDWWLYRVCMAFNGVFYFDKEPHIMYRQHSNNVVGGLFTRKGRFKHRLESLFVHNEGIRGKMALELLNGFSNDMPADNLSLLSKIVETRASFLTRISLFFDERIRLMNSALRRRFLIAQLLGKY